MIERRKFIRQSAIAGMATAIAPTILPSKLFGSTAPSKQVTLGFIGTGGHGTQVNLGNFLTHPSSRVLAVCDVKLPHARRAKEIVDKHHSNDDCKVYQDFRDVLARDDLDAVVISTPDHWHVPLSLMALRSGKHVFSEKPSLTITEGKELVEEVEKQGKVFQWGIEDRALEKYWMLAGLARTGAIGEVHTVDCGLPQKPLLSIEEPTSVPDDLDWNLWLGPAKSVEFTPSVTKPQWWRQRFDYSGGSLTDWGAHLCDTAQIGIGMDESGPSEILGTSEELSPKSFVDVPSGYDVLYRYTNKATIRVRDTARKIYIRFEGTKGWIQCEKWNGELSASDMNLFRNRDFAKNPDFWPRPDREQREFIDVVLNGGRTTYHVDAGHRLATMLHLGHMAIRSGETIHWDPKREQFSKSRNEHERSRVFKRQARDWEKGL